MTDETLKLPDPFDTGEMSVNRKLELIYQALTGLADQFTQFAANQAELAARQAGLTQQVAEIAAGQASLTQRVAELAAGQAEIVQRLDKLEKAQTEIARIHRYQENVIVQRDAAVSLRLGIVEERLEDLMKPKH